jgi:DNA/RNA-binding domain of Phe-tRNA-synthetase-like protein
MVLAMFAAELHDLLLTADHDRATVAGALTVDVASGSESYIGLGGRELPMRPDDMFIRDEIGILSSIVYGPDDRTQIRPVTQQAVFCVYAPPGIAPEAITRHLERIVSHARLIAPGASIMHQQMYLAS